MTLYQTTRIFILSAFIFSFLNVHVLYGQDITALEANIDTCKTFQRLSSLPNKHRQALDTVQYPWAEYSKGAIGNALWRTVYLSAGDEARLPGLINPPANSADKTRGELDYLLRLQRERTKKEIDRAEYIANIGSWPNIVNPTDPDYEENLRNLFYIAATATGKPYDYKNFPATTKLLMHCIQDIRVTEFRLKQVFRRPRPYHLEPALKPLARINSPSFPSGHSLWAYAEAYIFGELYPEKRTAFFQAAAEVQWSRELLGIHYPSDNEASRVIAFHLLNFWRNNPGFIADLQAAKNEWKTKSSVLK